MGFTDKDLFSLLIIFLAIGGVFVNVGSIGILVSKRRNSMFHDLLKILAFYDLIGKLWLLEHTSKHEIHRRGERERGQQNTNTAT